MFIASEMLETGLYVETVETASASSCLLRLLRSPAYISQLVLRDLEGRSVRPEEAPSIVAGFPHLVSASRVGNPVLIP